MYVCVCVRVCVCVCVCACVCDKIHIVFSVCFVYFVFTLKDFFYRLVVSQLGEKITLM